MFILETHFYNPHMGHNSTMGGILSSTGFKVNGSDFEHFLDDDGNGGCKSILFVRRN